MTDDDAAEAERLLREGRAGIRALLPEATRALREVANSEHDTKERREARRMLGLDEGSAD